MRNTLGIFVGLDVGRCTMQKNHTFHTEPYRDNKRINTLHGPSLNKC